MSYGNYRTVTHKVAGTTYRIDLQKKDYEGSSSEWTGTGQVFTHTYDKINHRKPWDKPVQKSSLDLHIIVTDQTELDILLDILDSDEDEYRLVKNIEGSPVWTGSVLKDLLEYDEDGFPLTATISAKDLSRLETKQFPTTLATENETETIITTIARLLNGLGYDQPITAYTSWSNSTITESDDFLNQIYNKTKNLRIFGGEGQTPTSTYVDDQPITYFLALEAICVQYGLILRQHNGFILTQLSELDDPTSVKKFAYNSSGVQQTSTTVDLTVEADQVDLFVRPGSRNKVNPGIKKAIATYNHRTIISGIEIPERFSIAAADDDRVDTMFFASTGDQSITLSAYVRAFTEDTPLSFRVSIQISAGDENWNNVTRQWGEGSADNFFNLSRVDSLPGGGEWWETNIVIQTDKIPDDAGTPLSITMSKAEGYIGPGSDIADQTLYENVKFDIAGEIEWDATQEAYALEQSGNYSTEYEFPVTIFGDGPTFYSPGALRYGTGDEELTSGDWGRRGATKDLSATEMLLKEAMDIQRNGTRNLYAILRGDYNPDQVVLRGSSYFFFLGGTQNGYDNEWSADFLLVAVETASDTLTTYDLSGKSLFNTGGRVIPAISSASIRQLQSLGFLARTSSVISGTISSIALDESVQVANDQTYILIDLFSGNTQTLTIDGDQSGTVISIDEITLNSGFPKGSMLFTSSATIQAGLITGDFFVKLFAQLNGVGVLTEATSGIYDQGTPIPNVRLYTTIIEGQSFNILDTAQNETIPVTIERETTYTDDDPQVFGPGLTDLPISEQTVNAAQGSFFGLGAATLMSYLTVDPGKIQGSVSKERTGDYLGRLSADLSGDGVTSVSIDSISEDDTLLDQQILILINQNGDAEEITVNGEQSITAGSDTFGIESADLEHVYKAGYAWVKEPSYKQTGRLTIQANQIQANVESINERATATANLTLFTQGYQAANALGVLSAEVSGSGVTSIPLKNVPKEIELQDGDRIQLISVDPDDQGQAEFAIVDGDQTITAGTDSITINSKNFTGTYDINSPVEVPAYDAYAKASLTAKVATENGTNIAGIESEVDTIGGRTVVFVNASGNLATIELLAGTEGSEINIDADFINLNDITIDSDGAIYNTGTTGFDGGITNGIIQGVGTKGWAIDRDGRIVAHQIDIRGGTMSGIDLSSNVGAISIVSTKANLPGSGDYDGEPYYVEDEPGGLYVWDDSAGEWQDTRNGEFILADSIVAGSLAAEKLSGLFVETGNLDVDGTLTIGIGGEIVGANYVIDEDGILFSGSGSEITNSGGDYRVDENGFAVQVSSGVNTIPERAYTIQDGSTIKSGYWASSSGRVFLESVGNNLNFIAWSGGTFENPSSAGGSITLHHNGGVEIGALSATLRLWNRTTTQMNAIFSPQRGAVVYNTTIDRIAYYTGSKWMYAQGADF